MRLRPSGRQGPVATSFAGFKTYQTNEAWTWEHLALTRARPIAGPQALQDEIEAFRRSLLASKRAPDDIKTDVAEMLARIAEAKDPSGAWDAKIGQGRMQAIELTSSAASLIAAGHATDTMAQLDQGWWSAQATGDLKAAYALLWRLRAASALLTDGPLAPDALGQGAQDFLMRETGVTSLEALSAQIEELTGAAAAAITEALGISLE